MDCLCRKIGHGTILRVPRHFAKFDENKRAHDARKRESGLTAAQARAEELIDLQWEAEKKALSCKPRTPSGAAALLLFAAELTAECDLAIEHIMPAIVNAATAIAGANVKISNRLAGVLAGDLLCGMAIA
jgi:hypothetical protein